MIRSLFYKEIKERKMALVLGLVLCLAPPVVMGIIRLFSRLSQRDSGTLSLGISWVFFFIFSVIFPAILASTSISGEVRGGTLPFLLSLPRDRWRVWVTKVLALWVMTYGLLDIFLLLNPPILGTEIFASQYRPFDPMLQILIISVPALSLWSTLLASTIFSGEMAATAGGILLTFGAAASLPIIARKLLWDAMPLEILIYFGGIFLVMLAVSLVIFIKGEQLDRLWHKLALGIKPLAIGLALWVLMVGGVYLRAINPTVIRSFNVSQMMTNRGMLMGVSFRYPFEVFDFGNRYYYSRDYRLWVVKPGQKPRSLPIRFAEDCGNLSPDGRYMLVNSRPAFDGPLKAYAGSLPSRLSLIDLETGKVTVIRSGWRKMFHSWIQWIDNRRFALISWDYSRPRTTSFMEFMDVDGRVLARGKLPRMKNNCWVNLQKAGSKLFINQKIVWHDNTKGPLPVSIYRVDVKGSQLSFEPVLTLNPTREGERYKYVGRPLSDDGKKALYYHYVPGDRYRAYVRDLKSGKTVEMQLTADNPGLENKDMFAGGRWLDNNSRILLWRQSDGDSWRYLFDPETGKVVSPVPSLANRDPYRYSYYQFTGQKLWGFSREKKPGGRRDWFIDFIDPKTGKVKSRVKVFTDNSNKDWWGRFFVMGQTADGRVIIRRDSAIYLVGSDGKITLYADLKKYLRDDS